MKIRNEVKENYNGWDGKSITDNCCSCVPVKYSDALNNANTVDSGNYQCRKCFKESTLKSNLAADVGVARFGKGYLLRSGGKFDDNNQTQLLGVIDSCQIAQSEGPCSLPVSSSDTDKLLYNSCKMCNPPMEYEERARAAGEALGVGLLNIFGVGGQASMGFKAADAAEEKAGGIVDSNTMVSKLQSQLDTLKEASLKNLTTTSIEVEQCEETSILNLYHNTTMQIKYLEQTIQFEIDELTIIQLAFSICILSILLYIFRAM